MGEIGQVTKVVEDEVVVKLERNEACAKCGACTASLESKDMFIHATNVCEAKVDDFVEIALEEENFIKAVMIMYGLPLVSMLVGIGLGAILDSFIGGIAGELVIISIGLAFAGLTFLWIKKNDKRFNTKQFKPRAVHIVTHLDDFLNK